MKHTPRRGMAHCYRAADGARHRGGFTIIEVLVSTLLWVIIIGTVIAVFIAQNRGFFVGNSYSDIHKEARTAIDWMTRDMRWASAVVSSHGTYTTSNSCAVLEIPSIDASGNVINVTTTHDYFVYRLNGTSLERIIIPNGSSSRTAQTTTVARRIGLLQFSSSGTPLGSCTFANVASIDVNLSARTNVIALNLSDNLSTTVKIRNKG